jgi:predicted nucleic acid-binding protein
VIVLDASAAVVLLIGADRADDVERRLLARGETLHAPHLFDVEVAHALRRLALRRLVDTDRAAAALDDLREMPLLRYPHLPLLERAWQLRGSVSIYDGVYLALAEALTAPLLTADAAVKRGYRGPATVEIV